MYQNLRDNAWDERRGQNGKDLFPRLMLLALLWLPISGIILAAPENPVVYRGNYDSIKETIVKTVQTKMEENQMIGLSLELLDGNRTVWVENFGYADAEHKIPVTGDTIFRVGSISKLFTKRDNAANWWVITPLVARDWFQLPSPVII